MFSTPNSYSSKLHEEGDLVVKWIILIKSESEGYWLKQN